MYEKSEYLPEGSPYPQHHLEEYPPVYPQPQSHHVTESHATHSSFEPYSRYQALPRGVVKLLSVILIISCALAFIGQIGILSSRRFYHYGRDVSIIGSGLWCGIFFAIAGGLGFYAAFHPTKSSLISFNLMSILSSVMGLVLLVIFSFGIYVDDNFYRHMWDFREKDNLRYAFKIIVILSALMGLIVSITCVILSARALVVKGKHQGGRVLYRHEYSHEYS